MGYGKGQSVINLVEWAAEAGLRPQISLFDDETRRVYGVYFCGSKYVVSREDFDGEPSEAFAKVARVNDAVPIINEDLKCADALRA
jgi:hypothetical protein